MLPSDLVEVIELDHQALNALVNGNPELKKALFSQSDDVTLANPFGPPVRGWTQVQHTVEAAASQMRDAEPIAFERVSEYASPDLAYILEFERWRGRIGDIDEQVPMSLRVTTIFRREGGEWKIIHRQADTITAARRPESVVERAGNLEVAGR